MLWCKVGFKLFSEGGQGGRGMNLIRKSIPNSGSIKSKTITKLFDRFMNRRAKLWNDKEITTTLTVPGTIRTAVGRKRWSKIPGKTCVKILKISVAVLNTVCCSTGSQCSFFSTGAILVFYTILAALFWMHCNLHRLNLEKLLRSELQ